MDSPCFRLSRRKLKVGFGLEGHAACTRGRAARRRDPNNNSAALLEERSAKYIELLLSSLRRQVNVSGSGELLVPVALLSG